MGEPTVAPLAGEATVTEPDAVAVPTLIVMLLLYDLPDLSHATIVTLCAPEASACDVFMLAACTVYLLTLST